VSRSTCARSSGVFARMKRYAIFTIVLSNCQSNSEVICQQKVEHVYKQCCRATIADSRDVKLLHNCCHCPCIALSLMVEPNLWQTLVPSSCSTKHGQRYHPLWSNACQLTCNHSPCSDKCSQEKIVKQRDTQKVKLLLWYL
jgi:hypothetical protein